LGRETCQVRTFRCAARLTTCMGAVNAAPTYKERNMEDILETVKIVNKDDKDGYCIINKCDLKEGDVLFGEDAQKAKKKAKKGKE